MLDEKQQEDLIQYIEDTYEFNRNLANEYTNKKTLTDAETKLKWKCAGITDFCIDLLLKIKYNE